MLLCGSPSAESNLDFTDLESVATYREPYHADHPVIRRFWSVFHSTPIAFRKHFLKFATGTDRVPSIMGLKGVQICFQPSGSIGVDGVRVGSRGEGGNPAIYSLSSSSSSSRGANKRKHEDDEGGEVGSIKRVKLDKVSGPSNEEAARHWKESIHVDTSLDEDDGGIDTKRLICAHTCAKMIDLPAYPTVARMLERLVYAVENSNSFELV